MKFKLNTNGYFVSKNDKFLIKKIPDVIFPPPYTDPDNNPPYNGEIYYYPKSDLLKLSFGVNMANLEGDYGHLQGTYEPIKYAGNNTWTLLGVEPVKSRITITMANNNNVWLINMFGLYYFQTKIISHNIPIVAKYEFIHGYPNDIYNLTDPECNLFRSLL